MTLFKIGIFLIASSLHPNEVGSVSHDLKAPPVLQATLSNRFTENSFVGVTRLLFFERAYDFQL